MQTTFYTKVNVNGILLETVNCILLERGEASCILIKWQMFFCAAKRCLCGCKLVSVQVSWVCQQAANALTAGNLPTFVISLPRVICVCVHLKRTRLMPAFVASSASVPVEGSVGN